MNTNLYAYLTVEMAICDCLAAAHGLAARYWAWRAAS